MSGLRRRKARAAIEQLTGIELNVQQVDFVIEYTKDYDHRRAAERIGMSPDTGLKMIEDSTIKEAIRIVYNNQMQAADITPETVKEYMLGLYNIAIQKGQLGVASKQLDQLARHSHVDAYAAQRVAVAADAEVAAALAGGRKRIAALKLTIEQTLIEHDDSDQEYNFL